MVLPRARALIACLPAAVLWAAAPVIAAEEPPLTLGRAIEQALAGNPDLAGFALRLRAQEGRTRNAGLDPPLEFRTEIENVVGTGRTRGIDAAEATFALSRIIELGGKREQRLAIAAAAHGVIEAERTAAQLDVLAEVTRRFIHVASDQEQLQLTARATALADATVTATTARLNAGRAPEVEVRRARIALARARVEQEHAEHELLTSRRQLAAMWGNPGTGFGSVVADLYAVPATDSFESLADRIAGNPDFIRFASESRLRDAEVRLAESRQRADITWSAGVRRLQETRDQAFVVGLTVPLGARDRARGTLVEAQALRDLTAAERHAHLVRAETQLFELFQELNHAVAEVQALRTAVLPEMEAALEATRYAFERGRYSYLEWVDAQQELVTVQRSLIEAAASMHLYRAEIERLTGESLEDMQ